MRAPLSTHRLAGLAALLLALPAHPVTAQTAPATFFACFVPSVGAIYMIKRTGLPQACLGGTHVEITWTDGAGAGTGTITAVTAGNGLTGGGTTGAVNLAVSFGGPGAATSVARSDHGHQLSNASNTAVGSGVLVANTTGTSNTAIGAGALNANTTGLNNTAVGTDALRSHVGADGNTAVGINALRATVSGRANTAVGADALQDNLTGSDNTAVGPFALSNNESGTSNVAVGSVALRNAISDDGNTALGAGALFGLTSGGSNIAIGRDAGNPLATGSRNIYIGSLGTASESDRIRIGNTGNAAVRTFVAGIQGATIASGTAVLVSSEGQLGIATSSRRFKEDIRPIGDAGRALMQLRPVGFRYIEPTADGRKPQHYGLIAEEVAEVLPELVARDSAGAPLTVYYQFLPVLMLDELQRQARELDALRAALAAQAAALEQVRAEVRRTPR